MIATFFQWKLRNGAEAAFRGRWNDATLYFLTQGSHGSSLWVDGDGNHCAFALWPNAEVRSAALAGSGERLRSLAPLVDETLARIDMDSLDNHWRLPASSGQSTEK